MPDERDFDILLFGATGYTGRYVAEHIVAHLPTNLKWALAGRSQEKLASLAEDLRKVNPDRVAPFIKAVQLSDMASAASETRLLINTVGPYSIHGEAVVQACVAHGTHYLDVTGESPWVQEMIEKYDSKAKSSGAIVISQIGVESAPADLTAYAVAKCMREQAFSATADVVFTLNSLKGGASGGTLATIMTIFDKYSLARIQKASTPGAYITSNQPQMVKKSLISSLLGVRTVSGLGNLVPLPLNAVDAPLVYRSWELLEQKTAAYGPNFQFSSLSSVRNALLGFVIYVGSIFGPLFLVLPPVRWLLRQFVYKAGEGPNREHAKNGHVEYRALAYGDAEKSRTVAGRARWEGDMYHLTGVLLAEAAATILYEDDLEAKRMGGGYLTPATLGQPYIDRLSKVGFRVEAKLLNS